MTLPAFETDQASYDGATWTCKTCGDHFHVPNHLAEMPVMSCQCTLDDVERPCEIFKSGSKFYCRYCGRTAESADVIRSCPKRPPPVTDMLWNVARDVATFIANPRLASKEEYERRLSICDGCERRAGVQCGACGCVVSAKAGAKAWTCPIGKWSEE